MLTGFGVGSGLFVRISTIRHVGRRSGENAGGLMPGHVLQIPFENLAVLYKRCVVLRLLKSI